MRSILKITLAMIAATSMAAVSLPIFAQTELNFPSKPVRLVTGTPGSTNDTLARIIGAKLAERSGQPVVLENRGGAGGTLAGTIVAKAAPDGYTLMHQSPQFAIGAALNANLPYDALKDFTGVTQIGYSTVALVVTPSLGVKSVKEFIALAQAKPGQLFYSSAGAGSSMHMNGERFRLSTGIKVTHVGFNGSPAAVIEVLAGRVHYAVPGLWNALPLIKDGKLIALAVIAPQRSPLLPDVPAMAEVLPGYEKDGSFGLLAPAKTPRPILNKISTEVKRILELPDVKDRLQSMGIVPTPTTPEEYDKILRAEIEIFTKVGKLAGLRAQ